MLKESDADSELVLSQRTEQEGVECAEGLAEQSELRPFRLPLDAEHVNEVEHQKGSEKSIGLPQFYRAQTLEHVPLELP